MFERNKQSTHYADTDTDRNVLCTESSNSDDVAMNWLVKYPFSVGPTHWTSVEPV